MFLTKEELIKEIKEDLRREAFEDAMHERLMRKDLDYALEYLGIVDIYDDIEVLVKNLSKYEHDLSVQDILEKLGEI